MDLRQPLGPLSVSEHVPGGRPGPCYGEQADRPAHRSVAATSGVARLYPESVEIGTQAADWKRRSMRGRPDWPRPRRDGLLPVAVAVAVAVVTGLVVVEGSIGLALALVLGAAFVPLVLARPEATMLGLIVVLPFMIYPVTVSGLSLFLAIPTVGLASAVLLLRDPAEAQRAARALPSRIFALFFLVVLATAIVSTDPSRALSRTAYLALFALFAWAMATSLISGRIARETLLRAVVLSGTLAAIGLGVQFVMQFIVGRSTVLDTLLDNLDLFGGEGAGFRNWQIRDPDVLRGIFPFMTPPAAGQYLMLTLVAAVGLRLTALRRAVSVNAFENLAPVLIGIGLLLTFSRQAWLGAVIGLLALVIIRRPRWLLALGLALAVAFFTPAPGSAGTFGDYFVSASDTSTRSSDTRIRFWEEAIELIPDYALVGVGPGLYEVAIDAPLGATDVVYAHNVFLDAAVEVGIAGALALIALLVVSIRLALRRRHDLVAAMLLAFVVASLFDDTFYLPRNGLLVALAFALIVPSAPDAQDDTPEPDSALSMPESDAEPAVA